MTRFRFSLSWLMLPLLASLSFLAIGEPLDGAAQALHLIGYIGADYPATVAGGQVIDAGEYQEQLEFLDVLQGLIVALPAQAGRAELEQGVSNLRQAIAQRLPGEEVAGAARKLGARLAEVYQVVQSPVLTPDPGAVRRSTLSTARCATATPAWAMDLPVSVWSQHRPICVMPRVWIG